MNSMFVIVYFVMVPIEAEAHWEWPSECASECLPRQHDRCGHTAGRLWHQECSSWQSHRPRGVLVTCKSHKLTLLCYHLFCM